MAPKMRSSADQSAAAVRTPQAVSVGVGTERNSEVGVHVLMTIKLALISHLSTQNMFVLGVH